MLSLAAVSASYGSVPAVAGVSIEVGEGEAVGLLGANGAGKSTTLRAISGLVRLTSGTISFLGTDTASLPPYKITELGIAHVPEGRQVFPEMTVQENLEIGAYVPKAKAERSHTLELVFNIFPVLAERRKQLAGTMSGGEQQMLAVGRGLMLKPRLLMLDEPSLGLAPVVTDITFQKIAGDPRHGHGDSVGRAERQPRAELGAARLCVGKRQGDHARHQRRTGEQQAGPGGVSRDVAASPPSLKLRRAAFAPLACQPKLRGAKAGGEGGIRTPDTVARMPHFECGAFNRSATSPEPEKSLKKPDLDGCYVTKQTKTNKALAAYIVRSQQPRPSAAMSMLNTLKFDRIGKELRGLLLTLCMVAAVTALIYTLIIETGLGHGSVVYLIPVVIAATRWGIVPAIFAAVCGVLASAFFFFPPLYTFRITDPHEVLNLALFIFVAVVVSHLATRLKRQLEVSRQREIDLRDLYAFSRRLAVAFDVSDIHAAIEDHLATVMQRKVVLFASAREAAAQQRAAQRRHGAGASPRRSS